MQQPTSNKVGVFEELPARAKKRRRTRGEAAAAAAASSTATTANAVDVHPATTMPPPPPLQVVAVDTVPRAPGQQGVGIMALDVTRLSGSQRVGIIGLPGTGKSTCSMSLLTELRYNFPVINVFSGSESDNPFYSLVIPKLFIRAKVSKRGLKQFINRQRPDAGRPVVARSPSAIGHRPQQSADGCAADPRRLFRSPQRPG